MNPTVKRAARLFVICRLVMLSSAWSYGSDSGTSTPQVNNSSVQDFYIGRVSNLSTSSCDTQYFTGNEGSFNTYGYAFLAGPAPLIGNAAFSFGVQQATNAYNCLYYGHNLAFTGQTIFGDVENTGSNYYGWYPSPAPGSADWQANVNVVSGFVSELQTLIGIPGGIYINGNDLSLFFDNWGWGNKWFPAWQAGLGTCNMPTNNYLSNPTGPQAPYVNDHNNNLAGNCLIMGQEMIVWQYQLGSIDYDISASMNDEHCMLWTTQPHIYYICGNSFPATY